MVDAAFPRLPGAAAGAAAATVAPAPGYRVVVIAEAADSALQHYGQAMADAVAAPPQHPQWIKAWADAARSDLVVALVEAADGAPALAVALEVVRSGPFRIARFLGASHANGNFPVTRRGQPAIGRPAVEALVAAIAAARPDIDLIAFERLLPTLDGLANPLLVLPHRQSPNPALAADLAGGFEALLKRVSGKRKKKKYRSQARRFEEAGGFRRIEAASSFETNRLLDAFFAMKAARFSAMGIANVFGPPAVQAFFRTLFAEALASTPPSFVLNGLEVGGVLRAVTGSSRRSDSLVCEFGSIADDALAGASPGSFLFFENIREAAEQGFTLYDFSVGDEPYKRLWCEVEIIHFDVFIPLTLKGRLLARFNRLESRLKATVKGSPLIWGLAKRLRRGKARALPTDD